VLQIALPAPRSERGFQKELRWPKFVPSSATRRCSRRSHTRSVWTCSNTDSCRLLIPGRDLGKSMSRYLVDEIERRQQVEVMTHREIVELKGQSALESVAI
jgi:hypothetical protein